MRKKTVIELLAKVPQYMGSDQYCDCQWFKLSRGLESYSMCRASDTTSFWSLF